MSHIIFDPNLNKFLKVLSGSQFKRCKTNIGDILFRSNQPEGWLAKIIFRTPADSNLQLFSSVWWHLDSVQWNWNVGFNILLIPEAKPPELKNRILFYAIIWLRWSEGLFFRGWIHYTSLNILHTNYIYYIFLPLIITHSIIFCRH